MRGDRTFFHVSLLEGVNDLPLADLNNINDWLGGGENLSKLSSFIAALEQTDLEREDIPGIIVKTLSENDREERLAILKQLSQSILKS